MSLKHHLKMHSNCIVLKELVPADIEGRIRMSWYPYHEVPVVSVKKSIVGLRAKDYGGLLLLHG